MIVRNPIGGLRGSYEGEETILYSRSNMSNVCKRKSQGHRPIWVVATWVPSQVSDSNVPPPRAWPPAVAHAIQRSRRACLRPRLPVSAARRACPPRACPLLPGSCWALLSSLRLQTQTQAGDREAGFVPSCSAWPLSACFKGQGHGFSLRAGIHLLSVEGKGQPVRVS